MSKSPKLGANERERIDRARTEIVKQLLAAERAKVDEKTAKLKALRLAKEAAEKAAAVLDLPPPKTAKSKRPGPV